MHDGHCIKLLRWAKNQLTLGQWETNITKDKDSDTLIKLIPFSMILQQNRNRNTLAHI